jgi:23S rRNA pseudouridine2605 synthase
MKERLQKYIAKCGIASRRKAEELIFEGRVKVNGNVTQEIVMIDEDIDIVEVEGKIIKPEENKVFIMLNKPEGVITSSRDQFNRAAVTDLVNVKERVYPVGRLDYDTSGLLILTNDGDAAYKITHPSHEIDKVYIASVKGIPSEEEMKRFRGGLKIEDYTTSPSEIRVLRREAGAAQIEITIHEGKNRQVRKMCQAIGHPVIMLKRIRIGEIEVGDLKEGQWRYLREGEIEYLKSL